MSRKSWVQDPITGKLIPKDEYVRRPDSTTATIMGDIEPFVSPITKGVISSRSQLRQHNRDHGVTDSRDYSPEFLHTRRIARENEMTGNTPAARADRIEQLKRALDNGH